MERLTDKNLEQAHGSLTIELMISLALMVLILSAIIMVSSGNQSILVDSQTNSEALNISQELLEKAQVDARKDFNLVNPYSIEKKYNEDEPGNFKYAGSVKVEQKDFFTKLVTAEVSWPTLFNTKPKIALSTLVTNFNNAVGGDTCSSIILPDAELWKNPNIRDKFYNFSSLTGISDNYPITDIDIYKDKLYVTVAKTTASSTPTFFVFDVKNNDSNNPDIEQIYNGFFDNDQLHVTGLNAVAVAEDPADGNVYAYVANASDINKQLQIIDVSTYPPSIVKNVKVSGKADGNSVFYKDGYVYLGLKSSSDGPEFSIVDAHVPLSAAEVGYWPKSGSLGHDINSIYVRGNYAYLITAGDTGDKKLIVLDISNVSAPKEVGSFSDESGNHGKSAYFVGDNLYRKNTGWNRIICFGYKRPKDHDTTNTRLCTYN
jgi:hypothetical protein